MQSKRHSGRFRNILQIFRHTQARKGYSGIIQAYSGIFRNLCNPGIFRTLVYSEPQAYELGLILVFEIFLPLGYQNNCRSFDVRQNVPLEFLRLVSSIFVRFLYSLHRIFLTDKQCQNCELQESQRTALIIELAPYNDKTQKKARGNY